MLLGGRVLRLISALHYAVIEACDSRWRHGEDEVLLDEDTALVLPLFSLG